MSKEFWECSVCGDVHYGQKAPDVCPTCMTKDAYDPVSKEEAGSLMGYEA